MSDKREKTQSVPTGTCLGCGKRFEVGQSVVLYGGNTPFHDHCVNEVDKLFKMLKGYEMYTDGPDLMIMDKKVTKRNEKIGSTGPQ